MADNYFADEQPSVRGGPAASGGEGSPENPLTKQAGPLPVWGWALVAIAGVFLYRRIIGPRSSSTVEGSSYVAPSSSQQMGGVFLLPSTGGGDGGAAAQSDSGLISAQKAIHELAGSYDPAITAGEHPAPSQADTAAFYTALQGTPASDRSGLQAFFAENAASKNLGLPYLTGKFDSAGNAASYDPSTGVTTWVNTKTGKVTS